MFFASRFMVTDYLVQKFGPEVGMWVTLLACLAHQIVPMKFIWQSNPDSYFGDVSSLNLLPSKE